MNRKRRVIPGRVKRKISPWSRRSPLALDQRTVEGRTETRVIRELIEQIGGDPTPAERILITRAGRLVILVEQIERSVIERQTLSDLGSRQLVALGNSLRQCLGLLGIKRRAKDATPVLRDYLTRGVGLVERDDAA